jgi:mannitol-1-phosphate/altronate dehydrogenase
LSCSNQVFFVFDLKTYVDAAFPVFFCRYRYEMMKLRLLNAGHSAISYASYLMQHRYVDSAMDPHQTPWHLAGLTPEQVQSAAGRGTAGSVAADPTVGEAIAPGANPVRAFCAALFEEATPTGPDGPGVDPASYKVDLLKRFSNP